MKRSKPAGAAAVTQDYFTTLCRTTLGVDMVREYRFHEKRMWRFDYAIPALRIAIEIDGGVWTNGRHNRASGYLGDLDKFNEAAAHGWLVLKFTPQNQMRTATLSLIRRAMAARQHEIGVWMKTP